MPQATLSGAGPDGEEPGSSPLPAAAGRGGPRDDWDGPDGDLGQGLYLCLPAGQVTLAGFAQDGQADTMEPGPLLATIVDTVTGEDGAGLAGCSDDQLMGVISAARRMEARAAWTQLAAVAEYARRHCGSGPADEFAPVELGFELHLTPQSAKEQMGYASTVATRLPATFAALHAGAVHPVHVRIIEDETLFLSDADAARADEILAQQAPGLTFGELRYAAHKLILALDPEAARKRKDAARGEAHVRPFREHSGNAGLIAHELPSDQVLASWQHVEQRALDLRAAGMPGTLRELRIQAYLDLLQERDSRAQPAGPPAGGGAAEPGGPLAAEGGTAEPAGPLAAEGGAAGPPGTPGEPEPGSTPGGQGGPGRAPGPGPASGPSLAALVTLTIPWDTWQGRSQVPGQAAGLGLLDGEDARDLAAAAARHPATRWCVTALNPDGTAAAHGCLPGRHPPPGTGPPGPAPPGIPPGTRLPGPPDITLTPITRDPCDHTHAETGYHPSRALAHLIRARNGTCTAPGCRRPAARCDLDHTIAWDQGGLTCECDLAPLCRHHHRCKQAQGWQLEQPEPGVLIWRVPCGRRYATGPTAYPI